jgi:hypothetical protein
MERTGHVGLKARRWISIRFPGQQGPQMVDDPWAIFPDRLQDMAEDAHITPNKGDPISQVIQVLFSGISMESDNALLFPL